MQAGTPPAAGASIVQPAYSNQPLITNFLPQSPLYGTGTLFYDTNQPYQFNTEDAIDMDLEDLSEEEAETRREERDLRIEGDGTDYTATAPGLGMLGDLQLYEEGGRYWINQIHVHDRARRRGIGRLLLEAAIRDHGTIYASTQGAQEDHEDDTRHLTDAGEALVDACIDQYHMNIVKDHPSSYQ